MARKEVPPTFQLDLALDRLTHGGLLLASTRSDGKSNVMTIGWSTIGAIWGLPMMVVMVRPSRYTFGLIEETKIFTVNVPAPEMKDYVAFCGSHSGRDVDKLAQVATSPGQCVNGITIDDCPLVYECQVVHWNDLQPDVLPPSIRDRSYPRDDFHRFYYGQIMGTFAAGE